MIKKLPQDLKKMDLEKSAPISESEYLISKDNNHQTKPQRMLKSGFGRQFPVQQKLCALQLMSDECQVPAGWNPIIMQKLDMETLAGGALIDTVYNWSTGSFIAPVSGTYEIWIHGPWQIQSNSNGRIGLKKQHQDGLIGELDISARRIDYQIKLSMTAGDMITPMIFSNESSTLGKGSIEKFYVVLMLPE